MTVTGPGGEKLSAEWVADDADQHAGAWLVSGDDALHALLDGALAGLRSGAATAGDGGAGSGAPVTAGDGEAGIGARVSGDGMPALRQLHACLGDRDQRVDSVYGQAVRDARADIVRFSNAFLGPDHTDLPRECAAISAWEPGEPLPFAFDFREEMSESVRREARAAAALRNAPRDRDESF